MHEPGVITAMRPDAPPRKKKESVYWKAAKWALRELMRLRLAVWLLIVMTVTMVAGSIFPQGYDADTYIESWGQTRYAVFSKLGLLNLFHTKYFLFLGGLLLLNLILCSVTRLSGRRTFGLSQAVPPDGARAINMGRDADAAVTKAIRVLTERGYHVLRATGGVLTARRGPWPEGVSLLYHLAMAVAILGFIASALHAFGGDVTLYPGEPVVVRTASLESGWHRFLNRTATRSIITWYPCEAARVDTSVWGRRSVTLTLNEFITEWELHKGKYYPKDWKSDLAVRVVGHGPEVYWPSRMIEVNRPLRAGGLTFYQMAYEQSFDVVVWQDEEEVERVTAQSYVPFTLESVEGMFFPGTLRVGTLFERSEAPRPVVPHVSLKWQPPETAVDTTGLEGAAAETPAVTPGERIPGTPTDETLVADSDTAAALAGAAAETLAPPPPPERVELGDLSAEEPLAVEGVTLTLENPYEGSVLTYRHDPGVLPLYIAIVAFIAGLALRTYWPSYRVSLWIEETPGGTTGRLAFRAAGILGEPEDIEDALVRDLGSGEITPARDPSAGEDTFAGDPGVSEDVPECGPSADGDAPARDPNAGTE
jgi:hypothetical protein